MVNDGWTLVKERLNGSLHICRDGVSLKYRKISERPKKAAPSARLREHKKPPIPAKHHPWRRCHLDEITELEINYMKEHDSINKTGHFYFALTTKPLVS